MKHLPLTMDNLNQPKKRKATNEPSPNQSNANTTNMNESSFPRFIVVESTEKKQVTSLSPFIIEKCLQATIGTPKSVKKLANGTLLIEVSRKQQTENLLRCESFYDVDVKCTLHKTLNSCKGIIRCPDLSGVPETEIAVELQDQKVSHVKRVMVTRDGKRVSTNTFIVTFCTPILPSSLKIGYMSVRVDVFIPNPLQCYNCFRFGHHERSCTSKSICKRCGTLHDDMENCTKDPNCSNCKEAHSATSRTCSKWLTEREVLRVKYTQSLSFPEARKIVTNQQPQQSTSYATVIKQKAIVKDCAVQVNLCQCKTQSVAIQTTIPNPKLKPVSNTDTPPKSNARSVVSNTGTSNTRERRTQVSSSPERVIQRKSPREKIVLTDRVKKGQRNQVLSPNRYEALSEESERRHVDGGRGPGDRPPFQK